MAYCPCYDCWATLGLVTARRVFNQHPDSILSRVHMAQCAQAHRHLHALHELCWALGSLRLHRLDAAQAPRLSAFAEDQAAALRAAGTVLAGFSTAIADAMVAGCTEALQALQDRLDQFAQRQVRRAQLYLSCQALPHAVDTDAAWPATEAPTACQYLVM